MATDTVRSAYPVATPYRTVIFFDLDGTLIDGPFKPAVLPAILDELAVSGLEPAALRKLLFEENTRRQADPTCPPTQAMDWDDIFQTIGQQLGIPVKTNAEMLIRTHAGPPHAVLHPGALETLQTLVAPERALVLATKGLRKYQQPILEALGILPYFNAILTPDSHQALKRNRAFYGDWPQRATLVLMVGDYYVDDVLPARAFGFQPVWKQENLPGALRSLDPVMRAAAYPYATVVGAAAEQSIRPVAIIHSLVELPQIVQDLEAVVYPCAAVVGAAAEQSIRPMAIHRTGRYRWN